MDSLEDQYLDEWLDSVHEARQEEMEYWAGIDDDSEDDTLPQWRDYWAGN